MKIPHVYLTVPYDEINKLYHSVIYLDNKYYKKVYTSTSWGKCYHAGAQYIEEILFPKLVKLYN